MTANKTRLFRWFLPINGTTGGALIPPFFGQGNEHDIGTKNYLLLEKRELPIDTTVILSCFRFISCTYQQAGVVRVSRGVGMGVAGARTDTVDQTEPPVMPMPVPRFRRDHANADNPCHNLTTARWNSTLSTRA